MSSWKDPEGETIKKTTKEAAISKLKSLREDIISGKSKFDEVASEHSDCTSAKRGGDLGPFGRNKMQKAFEEATYALKIGEISDIVDTYSGVHIIMRTAVETEEERKERHRKQQARDTMVQEKLEKAKER